MTACALLMKEILSQAIENGDLELDDDLNTYGEDSLKDLCHDWEGYYEYRDHFRGGQEETEIEPPHSRCYDSRSVAARCCGQWIGWTYWSGGGKHGEPEAIDWEPDAYFLDCTEEEQTLIVRTFVKKELTNSEEE